jgi:DNA adenine methylase
VAAAYQAVSQQLGEQLRPLQDHNAADEQTGSLGDVEITLLNDDRVITCYEMKMKRVIIADIDRAIYKLAKAPEPVDSYVFITTDVITQEVQTYAAQVYGKSGGTEMVVLDCIGFLRHFLHLFHRRRGVFMDAYQTLLLAEPDSAVSQALKEAFLVLRRVAEEAD